jgi:hypothetical protein
MFVRNKNSNSSNELSDDFCKHNGSVLSTTPTPKTTPGVPTTVESQSVVAASVLVLAVGCDALTAIDTQINKVDCPSSMRVSCLVLVLMMASPTIQGINTIDQRFFLGVILISLAILGTHEGSEALRTGDCIFSVFVLLASLYVYKEGGIENPQLRPDSTTDKPHRRQTVSALCSALLLYVGARGLKDAYFHASVANNYEIQYASESMTTKLRWYAVGTTSISVPLGFGYGMTTVIGLITAFDDDVRLKGSHTIAFEVGYTGIAICIASMWSFLGQIINLDENYTLYTSASTCRGTKEMCLTVVGARRLAAVNGCSGSLWMAGLAALCFSVSIEKHASNNYYNLRDVMCKNKGSGFALSAVFMAVVGIFMYSTFEGRQWHTEVCVIASFLGIFISTTWNSFFGTLICAIAMTYDEVQLITILGWKPVLEHLTHCTLIIHIACMWTHITLSFLKYALLSIYTPQDLSVLNKSVGAVSTFGTSLTFALYLASAILVSAANGELLKEGMDTFRDNKPSLSCIAFILDHFVPLFVWIPLFLNSADIKQITPTSRTILWLVTVPIDAVVYTIVLIAIGINAPSLSLIQLGGGSVVGFAGLVAWTAAAFS